MGETESGDREGPTAPTPPRRWWKRLPVRLSLRTLMALVLAFACGLGWVAHRARVQRDAVAAIERAGGKVHYDWQIKYIKRPTDYTDLMPNPAGVPPGPKWLVDRLGLDYFATVKYVMIYGPADPVMPHVGRLDQLEELDFLPSRKDRTTLGPTDAGMVYLQPLTQLRHLKLGISTPNGSVGAKLTGAGLASIAGCTQLWYLQLQGIPLVDADLAALRGMTDLRNLEIDSPNVTAAGLANLRGMTRLSRLDLTRIDLDTLEPLRLLAGLTHLHLAGTPIGDAGLIPASAPGFAGLKTLSLPTTKVTDAGLKPLGDLPNLTLVNLIGTAVTDAGIAEFRKAHPNINMFRTRQPSSPRNQIAPAKKSAAPAKN